MNTNEWYRGDGWDLKTQELFENKLKKARGNYNKAQYLRIKGIYLINSTDVGKRNAGVKLLNRVIKDYPDAETEVFASYELLGDYLREYDIEESEKYYRKVISYYAKTRNGTSGIVDVKLAELIVESKQKDKFVETLDLLTVKFVKTKGRLYLKEDKFRYALVNFKLNYFLGNIIEAKQYAQSVINLIQNTETPVTKEEFSEFLKNYAKDIEMVKSVIN